MLSEIMIMPNLSLVVLTRNEEDIVVKNLEIISEYLRQLKNITDYEILVCDKSEDSTPTLVKNLTMQDKKIIYCDVGKRGIGAAIKHGIDEAKYDLVMFYPIDMAWKIDIIESSINVLIDSYDIVYGSRYADGAKVHRPLKRRIFSMGYRILIAILFNIKIKDLNGTIALKKRIVMNFRTNLEDDGSFFPTELAIFGERNNLKIIEIASEVSDLRNTSNKFVFKAASNMMKGAIRTRLKLFFCKGSLK